MVLIIKFWRGDVALVISFWVFGIVGLRVFSAPYYLYFGEENLLYRLAIYALTIFIYVGAWNSARNYEGSQWWARLAQAVIVVGVLFEIAAVVTGILNAHQM